MILFHVLINYVMSCRVVSYLILRIFIYRILLIMLLSFFSYFYCRVFIFIIIFVFYLSCFILHFIYHLFYHLFRLKAHFFLGLNFGIGADHVAHAVAGPAAGPTARPSRQACCPGLFALSPNDPAPFRVARAQAWPSAGHSVSSFRKPCAPPDGLLSVARANWSTSAGHFFLCFLLLAHVVHMPSWLFLLASQAAWPADLGPSTRQRHPSLQTPCPSCQTFTCSSLNTWRQVRMQVKALYTLTPCYKRRSILLIRGSAIEQRKKERREKRQIKRKKNKQPNQAKKECEKKEKKEKRREGKLEGCKMWFYFLYFDPFFSSFSHVKYFIM